MNSNSILLTPELYEKLKEDIKNDVKKEMQVSGGRVPTYSSAWELIKRDIENKFTPQTAYQIIAAVSSILRCTLGLPNIKYLSDEQGRQAKKIFSELFTAIEELKGVKG